MKGIVCALLLAGCYRPTADDAQSALKVVAALDGVDEEVSERLLFESCAEMKSCAHGCEKALRACSNNDVDPSQRAVILASCGGLDFRGLREKDRAVTPATWIRRHTSQFYDQVAPLLDGPSGKRFAELRGKAKL